MLMFNCPLSPQKADRIIEMLDLNDGARIVDVGCGAGEFLIRTIERHHAHGVGIDPDALALDECRRRAGGRVNPAHIELHAMEAGSFSWNNQDFDAAICIGSVHAFGGYVPALRQLKKSLRPGGTIVVGDLFWHGAPAEPYRKILGEGWPPDDLDFAALGRSGEQEDLVLVYATSSSADEWDHFEASFAQSRYKKAWSHPVGPERASAVKKAREWYDAYLQWGRGVMGFGFYAYRSA
jgi:SAM-dependent methyltransferase